MGYLKENSVCKKADLKKQKVTPQEMLKMSHHILQFLSVRRQIVYCMVEILWV